LCRLSPLFKSQEIREILEAKLPSKVREMNLKAFDTGGSLVNGT